MVQKYQSPVRVYKYPFELVMAAYERRFPTCKMIPVFVGSEILSEFNSEDGTVTIIERRCKLNVDAPYLLKKIAGVEFVYFIQKNSLDRRKRILKIEAHNESFASRIGIVERCAYTVHPENSDWTCFEQSASLDVKSFFGFENAVEKVAMKQYSQNIKKGKEVIEFYINELLSEGITHIPLFEERKKLPEIKVTEGDKLLEAAEQPPLDSTQVDVNLKLESDYIERRLGKLTPYQESCLVRLKKWMAEAHQGKVPSDQTLVRFLQAQDYNLEKARETLCQSLVWRKKYQVDRILNSYNLPEVVTRYFPGGWHKHDRSGRPLYILRLGQMDVKGFIKSIGEEGLVKLTLHVCEEGLKKTEETATKRGKPIYSWTCLLDLEGLNMRHLWRPGVKALLHIIEMVETNYPETMGLVLIVRAPRVFPILWTLVSTFISDNTRSKFIFYGGNDYQGSNGLQQIIDKECLPDFLGGDSQANICEGGLVPKSYYMSEEEYERERAQGSRLFDDSMYHSVSLGKGQVHEIVVEVAEKGSVICWDFDVLKEDVNFSVILAKEKLPPPDSQSIDEEVQGCAHASLPLAMLNLDSQMHIVIPKQWKLGQEYILVEPSLICHDGESVQGTHVASLEGTYVLQWRHLDTQHHHHSFDFPLHQHKAKVMYYYELLKSRDYKGSMSSLQSSHSAATFNSASEQSAVSNCTPR